MYFGIWYDPWNDQESGELMNIIELFFFGSWKNLEQLMNQWF